MRLFQHANKEYLRLIRWAISGINVYLVVDRNNEPIIDKRSWSAKPTEQRRIVTGFNKLTEIK